MEKIYLFNRRRWLARMCYTFLLVVAFSGAWTVEAVASHDTTTPVYAIANVLQGVTVSGKVTDNEGGVLPGVSILEKGTVNGTVSDGEGNFRLTVSSGQSVLVFSFVGALSQEITVGTQTEISVQMQYDSETLSEVVVVGYGTQEKKDVTGSVAAVESKDFNKGIINSPEQMLQGKVAGVMVTSASGEPGGGQSIVIRGQGTVRSGTQPLYVVDGMLLDSSPIGGAFNPMNFINPQDIESQVILKDASATAIYGARGANGVIIITTKKGKSGQAKVNFTSDFGISKMARKIDVFSASEFRQHVQAIDGELTDLGGDTDWQEEITRTAYTQNHNLSVSGGSEKMTYYASIGMQNQEGILKDNSLKRYNGRINMTQKVLNDRASIDLNLNVTNIVNRRPPIEGVLGSSISLNPTYPAYDPATGKPTVFADVINPLTQLDLFDDITNTTRIVGNISPSVEIIKGLTYKLNLGVDISASDRDIQYKPSTTPQQDGDLDSYFNNNKNTLVENYLTYEINRGDHAMTFLAGHSYQKFFVQDRRWSIDKFTDNGIEPRYNPGLGKELDLTDNAPGGSAKKDELQSFYGRVNYGYKDRYLLTATVRADGSSRFGGNNKYGTFPSFSLGWRISEEAFMASVPVTNLKLRLGWGITGNQEFPSKQTQARFTSSVSGSTTYPLDGGATFVPGITYTRVANPDLQWESSKQTNVGIDFALLNGSLSGTVDYFHKVSEDILLETVVPDPIQVVQTYYVNVDDMTITNKGVELSLNYSYQSSSSFKFSVGGNITFINNEVQDSPFKVITTGSATGSGLTSATINGYINGEPIGAFYMKDFIGIDENGNSIFRDAKPDGVATDEDRVVAGSATPTKTYGFYGNVGFKGFDLGFTFNGVSGNKIYDNTANANFYRARLAKSLNTTDAALEFPTESNTNPAAVSTRYLKDGSFLRLNNVSLGYSFNTAALGIGDWIKGIRVAVTGQNLFVITDYDGYDPEVNTDRTVNRVTSYGIDYQSYPKARTYMVGVNVTF